MSVEAVLAAIAQVKEDVAEELRRQRRDGRAAERRLRAVELRVGIGPAVPGPGVLAGLDPDLYLRPLVTALASWADGGLPVADEHLYPMAKVVSERVRGEILRCLGPAGADQATLAARAVYVAFGCVCAQGRPDGTWSDPARCPVHRTPDDPPAGTVAGYGDVEGSE